MKTKFRFSYSFLSAWSKGLIDQAISIYLHTDDFANEAMLEGRRLHKVVEEHIRKNKMFPEWFSKMPLKNPTPEQKFIIPYNDLWDMSFVIDCMDGTEFHEYKFGKTEITSWARSYQIPLYFLGFTIMGKPMDLAHLTHYNQFTKKREYMSIAYGDGLIEKARNWVDSIAPEAYYYLKENKII